MALKYTAMHVKKKGRVEDFYTNLSQKDYFFFDIWGTEVKTICKVSYLFIRCHAKCFLLWYTSLQGYRLLLQVFLCHQYSFKQTDKS